jgi:hypothetical protein
MPKRRTVTVEIEAWKPRPYLRDKTRMTKKTFPTWVNLGKWPVLYHDQDVVVVKQFGSISLYEPTTGQMRMGGYRRDHLKAKLVPESHGGWRLSPESVKQFTIRRKR